LILPEWFAVIGFLLGAVVGSFLNMVIYRLPRGLSFVEPSKSFCPKCKHPLGVVDLFPLFSWLSTGGKCRYCKEPVAVRYFVVELIMGSVFAAIWWQYLIATYAPVTTLFYCLTAACLLAAFYIDWELYIIPDELNAVILVFGIGYHAVQGDLMTAIWGALLGWGLIWGIAMLGLLLFRKDAMGHGDIKLMRGVGALLGPLLLGANVIIAVFVALAFSLTFMALAGRGHQSGQLATEEEEMPPPETPGHLILCGVWYLLCLDIPAIAFPKMYRLLGEEVTSEQLVDDENWKPSLTTIPFGPYLAIGAIICMIFAAPITKGIGDYWRRTTGADESTSMIRRRDVLVMCQTKDAPRLMNTASRSRGARLGEGWGRTPGEEYACSVGEPRRLDVVASEGRMDCERIEGRISLGNGNIRGVAPVSNYGESGAHYA